MQTRNVKKTRGEHTQRERVWIALRSLMEDKDEDQFTRVELEDYTADVAAHTMVKTLQILRRHEFIERVGTMEEDSRYAVYRVVDLPTQFPECVSTRVQTWRQQAWNALRIQGVTTVPSMKATFHEVDPKEDTIYRYLRRLEEAGYLKRAGRNGPKGQVMSHIRWMLVNDTGPTAPSRRDLKQEISEQKAQDVSGQSG